MALVDSYEDDLETLLLRKRVIAATPALRSRALERQLNWETATVDGLAERDHPGADGLLELRVTVSTTLAALRPVVAARS
jgi:hypothetical protein